MNISMHKKIFILEPRAGLCNQLNCIAIGIILGILYDRSIYFNGFQIDYKSENILNNFDDIIDIDNLINITNNINIKIDIIKKFDKNIEYIPKLNTNEESISNVKDIFSYLSTDYNLNNDILNLKNPISTYIPDEYQQLYNYLRLNIKFHQKFYDIAHDIKTRFELDNYCCIHLRMENDALQFVNSKLLNDDIEIINDIHKQIYISEIDLLSNMNYKIYVCTSLEIYDNINNLFYKIIKKKYNLFDKNDIIKDYKLSDNDFNQRELYGIIDYIIASQSNYFIGADWSSFSIAIKNNHENNNKNYNLLKIFDMCSNA